MFAKFLMGMPLAMTAAIATLPKPLSATEVTMAETPRAHGICYVQYENLNLSSEIFSYAIGSGTSVQDTTHQWREFVSSKFNVPMMELERLRNNELGCYIGLDEDDPLDKNRSLSHTRKVQFTPYQSKHEAEKIKRESLALEAPQPGRTKESGVEGAPDPATGARDIREAREAEFQQKLAAQQAAVQEYQRKVAEREAEIARQAAQKDAAQKAAAQAQAAHEKKMAAHQRELDEANRRQEEYEAARRRHLECLSWNKQACDDIVAGKPVVAAEAQSASTDTDPNTCVTTPEIRLNAAFEGNTSASVMNGCGQPVDIRICLKRDSGWNCGVTSAVASQAKAVHSSFEATGEVFVDARTTGNARRFADPPN